MLLKYTLMHKNVAVADIEIDEDLEALNNDDSEYEVFKADKNTYVVEGGKVSRLASVTDIRNTQQIKRFTAIRESIKIIKSMMVKP